MSVKASQPRLVFEYGRGTILSFEIDQGSKGEAQRIVDDLREGYVSVEAKPWKDKRSLDANAYCWKLLGLMADKLTRMGAPTSKDDIYDQELRKYGQTGVIKIAPGAKETILKSFRLWEPHEKLYGEEARYYRVWVGSSHYNTEEMSAFIDGIVDDAKELGIETLPPDELERMMSQWRA